MDSNTTAETVFKDFVVRERQEICRSLVVSGNFIMESNSAIFGTVTVISGSVTLGNFSFIKTLYMPNGGEIFFKGKKPCIRHLDSTGITIHTRKNCECWSDFVQIKSARNITVIRDL